MALSRTDRSVIADWWFTVDRVLIAATLVLVATGVVLALAASPAVAIKKGLPAFYFVNRHVVFVLVGLLIMLVVSLASPRLLRRLALVAFVLSLLALIAVLLVGPEINGARRWLRFLGLSLQPSEFAKPAFVLLAAWAFGESQRRRDMPGLPLAIGFYVALIALLIPQPDVGQTLLVSVVWGGLFVLAGQPLVWAGAFAVLGLAGLGVAYGTLRYVQLRVDRFVSPLPGENMQVERAMRSFVEGGFLGRGPGEGTIKTALPDAHTDFIFAVVAEEYGVAACLAILFLFALVVLRALAFAMREPDPFVRHAVAGLALLIGLQALINMGVNVGLIPAKGMTLPFLSVGGSSTLATALTFGALIGLTRRRADPARLQLPELAVTPEFSGGGRGPVRRGR